MVRFRYLLSLCRNFLTYFQLAVHRQQIFFSKFSCLHHRRHIESPQEVRAQEIEGRAILLYHLNFPATNLTEEKYDHILYSSIYLDKVTLELEEEERKVEECESMEGT